MRVFIVGGTGFVGVNLANRLRARGDEVTLPGHAPVVRAGWTRRLPSSSGAPGSGGLGKSGSPATRRSSTSPMRFRRPEGSRSFRPRPSGTTGFTVTNPRLTHELGRVLHRPSFVPAPGFAVRLALGEFADTLLKGQRVLPRRLTAAGFRFVHPGFAAALEDLAPSL